jgi:hypothetical protein
LAFSPNLTARDQSLLLLVAWYAAGHGLDGHGMVDVPDLDMRRALGGLKTLSADREDGYYARLETGAMRTDERLPDLADGVPVPSVTAGMRRVTIAGAKRWSVDTAIVEGFKLRIGEPVVQVPLALLARSRCRFTLPLFLRAAAWMSGDYEPHWLLRRRRKATEFKLSLDDLREVLATDGKPADIERKALAPAVLEIDHLTDMAIEYEMIAKPSISGPRKVRAIRIMVGGAERVLYNPARRPRSFSEIGKPATPPTRVLPFTVPYAKPTRKVSLALRDDEDVPF